MAHLGFVETRDGSLHHAPPLWRTPADFRAPQKAGSGVHRGPSSARLVWMGISLFNTLIPAASKPVQLARAKQSRCGDYRWSFAGSMACQFLGFRQVECFAQERRHVGWKVCPLVLTMDWLGDFAVDWPSEDFRAARMGLLKLNFDRGPAVLGATIQYCPTSSVDRIMRAMMTVEMFVRYRPFSLARELLIGSMKTDPRPRALTAACLSPKASARMAQGRCWSGNEEAGPTGPLPGNCEEKDKQDGACAHARLHRARRRAFSHLEGVQ